LKRFLKCWEVIHNVFHLIPWVVILPCDNNIFWKKNCLDVCFSNFWTSKLMKDFPFPFTLLSIFSWDFSITLLPWPIFNTSYVLLACCSSKLVRFPPVLDLVSRSLCTFLRWATFSWTLFFWLSKSLCAIPTELKNVAQYQTYCQKKVNSKKERSLFLSSMLLSSHNKQIKGGQCKKGTVNQNIVPPTFHH
jgi:hypothetical protein